MLNVDIVLFTPLDLIVVVVPVIIEEDSISLVIKWHSKSRGLGLQLPLLKQMATMCLVGIPVDHSQ